MADIAINHLSTPQIEEIVGDSTKLKYRKFVLANKDVGGKRMSKKLVFDEGLIGKEMTAGEKRGANLDLYAESEATDTALMKANPEFVAKMKYLCRADYKELFVQNDEMMQAMLTNLYTLLSQDQFVDHEGLLRELMYSYFKGKGDRLIMKNPQQTQQTPNTSLGNQVMQKSMTPAIAAAGVS